MEEKHEYKKIVPDDQGKNRLINKKPRNLIKSEQVVSHEPVLIKINEDDYPESGPSSIQPIIEDGVVVGMFYRCICGRTEEIKFIYEN